jgi:uncharacterized membrane protein
MSKDYFKILELEPGCSIDDIKNAYRRLAKKYHPDLNKSPEATSMFIEITEAYEVLSYHFTHNQTDKTEIITQQRDYDEFIRKVREAAQRRAHMKYEKFKKEQEAFQESGLYDVVLLLKYIGLVFLPILATGLILFPIFIAISSGEFYAFFYLFYFWIIGLFLFYYILQQGKTYFRQGKFYYSFHKLLLKFTQTKENPNDRCFFCKNLPANSIPYKIEMYKVKNIRLSNQGPLQHQAGFDRSSSKIILPRSKKALFIHTMVSALKLSGLLYAVFFLQIDSFIWRFIFGLTIGWVAGSMVLWISATKSKVGYLLSFGNLIKIVFWLVPIILISEFHTAPFNIYTNEWDKLIIVLLGFADSIVEQALKIPKKHRLFKPLLKPYKILDQYYMQNYYLYLEIPFYTAIAPIWRWLF